MLTLFYKIWVDFIGKINLQSEENKKNWQSTTMLAMTFAMTSNFVLLMIFLQKFIVGHYFYKLDLSFFPKRISTFVGFVILYILPWIIINYLLIFRNRRYEELLKKYPFRNGRLFKIYFLISVGLPIVLLIGGMIFFRNR
jgi:hypothetical protein